MSKSWSLTQRYFTLTLIIAGLIWLLVTAEALIGPLAISALLAYVLNPAVTFVNRRTKIRRRWVAPLVYLVSLAALVGIAVTVVPLLLEQITSLSKELQTILLTVEEGLARPIIVLGFQLPVDQLLTDIEMLSADFVRPDLLLGVLRAASTNLGWALVILVTTYSLLQDWPQLREWLIRLAPDPHRADARRLYEEVRVVWERYLRGQLRLMIIVGVITGLASAAVGLPGAFALGLLSGLLDVILTVGPAIAMAIAAAVALFAGSTFLPLSNLWFAILVLAIYNAIKIVEDVWLRPRIMGHTLKLHPTLVFIGVIGGLALAGVLVALMVIPLLGSAAVIGHYLYAKIMDIDPWPDG